MVQVHSNLKSKLRVSGARVEQALPSLFNFTNADVEIAAGDTKTFSVQITNPGTNYAKASATGRAADYFQLTLVDDIAGNINWVADYNNATTAIDTASVIGTLRNLPLYGPTFQR